MQRRRPSSNALARHMSSPPYAIGGHRIVSELLAPGVTSFLDTVLEPRPAGSLARSSDRRTGEYARGRDAEPRVGGVERNGQSRRAAPRLGSQFDHQPIADLRLVAGDTLVALGPHPAVHSIGVRAMGATAHAAHPTHRALMKPPPSVG